ncbi:MAG: hypothetical protein V1911_00050 [Candidatus Micrarchaeota archaeon]
MPFANAITNPLSWLMFEFLGSGLDMFVLLKIAFFASLIAYPFVLAGKMLYSKIGGSINRILKVGAVTFAMLLLFFVFILVWTALFGNAWKIVDFGQFAVSFAVSWAALTALVLGGIALDRKMSERYEIPGTLKIYIIDLVMSIVCLSALAVSVYIIGSMIGGAA